MAGKETPIKANTERKRIQKYFGGQGISMDLWWYLRKIYHPDEDTVELILPDGNSLFFDNKTNSISDITALKGVERLRLEKKIKVMDSFNTSRFKDLLFGGEYIKKLIIKSNKKSRHTIEATFPSGAPVRGEKAIVQISAKQGMYYIDCLEDEVKETMWVNRLTELRTEQMRPQIEEMYGQFCEAAADIPKGCRDVMTSRECDAIGYVTIWKHNFNQRNIRSSLYRKTKWVFLLEYRGVEFLYDLERDSLGFGGKSLEALNKISWFKQYGEIYNSLKQEIEDRIPDGVIKYFRMTAGKDGIPLLRITLTLGTEHCTLSVSCTDDPAKMEKFYKRMEKKIQSLREAGHAKQQAVADKLTADGLYGSVLAADIIRYIKSAIHHPTLYSAAVSMRSGIVAKHDTGCGKYQMLPNKEIQDFIRKMIDAGVLRLKYSYNADRIWLKDKELCEAILSAAPLHYGTDRDFAEYTDIDWLAFLENEDHGTIQIEEWAALAPVFNHRALCCRETNKIAAFFSKSPEKIKEYLKTLVAMEENEIARKIIRQ